MSDTTVEPSDASKIGGLYDSIGFMQGLVSDSALSLKIDDGDSQSQWRAFITSLSHCSITNFVLGCRQDALAHLKQQWP